MDAGNAWVANGATEYVRRLDEYKEAVSRLFPGLSRGLVDNWSISSADALALGHFLECYPREVIVLDIGTFIGASALYFASQPKVLRVISVDPNPSIADEINDKSEMMGGSIDPEPLQNLRVLDVARAALAEFDDERQKIQLREGTVGSSRVSVQGGSVEGLEKVEVPMPEPSEGVPLLAFVDGLHTREGVQADLEAIFGKNPHAVVILDDCRRTWGPFVQAGVVSFMETAKQKYHFRLFGDLSPALATSSLGIFYPDTDAAEAEQTLMKLGESFSKRLDLLRLLRREEELIDTINEFNRELKETRTQLAEAEKRAKVTSQLQERNSRLTTRLSSRRYKLADALAESVLQVPGARKLARQKPPQ